MDRIVEIGDPRLLSAPIGPKKPGPPNRMNDLNYTEWMKFQKSFYRACDTADLVRRCVEFFTKETWKEGQPSKTLLINVSYRPQKDSNKRIIHIIKDIAHHRKLLKQLEEASKAEMAYDYIFIDMRSVLTSIDQFDNFLLNQSQDFFKLIRQSLNPGRYCSFLFEQNIDSFGSFPIAWSFSSASRDYLRVRDEKIGIEDELQPIQFLMNFQAEFDARESCQVKSGDITYSQGRHYSPPLSWTIPKPPPRKKNELLHPAKFPETLIAEFIDQYTEKGDLVYDPMVGTGSTLVAGASIERAVLGSDLSETFVQTANERLNQFNLKNRAFVCDIQNVSKNPRFRNTKVDYIITSPPYWSMLNNKGSENQRSRRAKNLPLVYSESPTDFGNIMDYDQFVSNLVEVYEDIGSLLKKGKYLTIIVKNVKKNHTLYPLAFDLTYGLANKDGLFSYEGCTFWCQDDIGMKPFAVGTHWVSNIVHQYCLHFKMK